MLNTIVHTELATKDVHATRTFFQNTFHWKFEDAPAAAGTPPYTFVRDGQGNMVGGIRPVDKAERGPSVANYIGVADIKAAQASIEKNGGKIISPVQEIPEMGKMLTFEAPGGNIMACWQDTSPRS